MDAGIRLDGMGFYSLLNLLTTKKLNQRKNINLAIKILYKSRGNVD